MVGRPVRLFVLAAAVAVFSGSAARAETTFYEAYENGLAHEKAGAWTEARESFLKAAALRPGPVRRAKTYGLNFIEPYDPAIHLARASLHLGLLDEAWRNLQIALSAAVSPGDEIAALASEIEAEQVRSSVAEGSPEPSDSSRAGSSMRPERTAPAAPALEASGTTPSVPDPQAADGPLGPADRTTHRPAEVPPTPAGTATVQDVAASPREASVEVRGRATPAPSGSGWGWPGSLLRPRTRAAVPGQRVPGEAAKYGLKLLLASGLALLVLAACRLALAFRDRVEPSPEPVMTVATPVRETAPAPSDAPSEERVPEKRTSPSGNSAGNASGARPLREGADPRFGAYVLEGILGRGGMGTTYAARRLRDGFPVALKVPHEHILEEPEFVERFLREGALGAMLHHPNIVRIYEAGEHAGRPFIAMEIVPGTTLERTLRKEPRLPLERALHVARGIALALDYAHMKGIVHRDLKPENVMVLPDGEVKVMDYGIARRMDISGLTATDVYLGTPHYSAPESLYPAEVGPQSDLYSLGVILFRILSGELPFTAPTQFEVLHRQENEPLPPLPPGLGIPPEVYGLLLKLTEKSKEERYATAELFLRDLDRVLNRL